MKNCECCGKKIPLVRIKVLPDTKLCVKCSDKVGGDYETIVLEENVGSTIISNPIIHKKRRVLSD